MAGRDIALVETPDCLSSFGSCCHLRYQAAVRLVGRLNEPPCSDLVTSVSFSGANAWCLISFSDVIAVKSENPEQHPAASQQASWQHLCAGRPALYVKSDLQLQEIKPCISCSTFTSVVPVDVTHWPLVVKMMLNDLQFPSIVQSALMSVLGHPPR